jgi:hypothetical protein
MRALFRKKKRVFLLWVFCSKRRELLSTTQKLLSFSVFKEKGRKTTTTTPPQTLFFISNASRSL